MCVYELEVSSEPALKILEKPSSATVNIICFKTCFVLYLCEDPPDTRKIIHAGLLLIQKGLYNLLRHAIFSALY